MSIEELHGRLTTPNGLRPRHAGLEAAAGVGRPPVTSRSRREEMLRRQWLEVLRAELGRRNDEEEDDALREQRIAAFEDELRALAERLTTTEGSLLEDASIAQRLAVVTYLPHRLTATELEEESAAIDAWFQEHYGRR
jgi:hypothetical protein